MCPTSRSPRPEEPMMNNVAVSKLCDLASHWNTPVLSPFCPNKSGPFFVPFDTAIQRYQQNLESSCFLNLETWELHSTLNELYYWGILKCQQGSCSRSQRPRVRLLVNPNAMGLWPAIDKTTLPHGISGEPYKHFDLGMKMGPQKPMLPRLAYQCRRKKQTQQRANVEKGVSKGSLVPMVFGSFCIASEISKNFLKAAPTRVAPRDAVRGLRQCVLVPKKAEADPRDIILVRATYKCWCCLIYLKLNSGHLAKILLVNQHSGWCFLCHATFAKVNDWQGFLMKVTCLVRLTFNQSCFGSWNWCLSMVLIAPTPPQQNKTQVSALYRYIMYMI